MKKQRGLIPVSLILYGVAAVVALGGIWWVWSEWKEGRAAQKEVAATIEQCPSEHRSKGAAGCLKEVNAQYVGFVAETKRLGDAAEAKARAQEKERAALTKKTESDHAQRTQSLTTQIANAVAAARVRDKPDTSRSSVPALSSAASSISCPDRQSDVTGRLERLEVGILERLIGRGNAAIERTAFCKEWLDSQAAVKP